MSDASIFSERILPLTSQLATSAGIVTARDVTKITNTNLGRICTLKGEQVDRSWLKHTAAKNVTSTLRLFPVYALYLPSQLVATIQL